MEGEYRLRSQTNGRGHFAHVRVSLSDAPYPSVLLGPEILAWVKDDYGPDAWTDSQYFDDLRNGALSGAIYGLHRAQASYLVTVNLVRGAPADTGEEDVRFATAYAVWDALGFASERQPSLNSDGFHFPNPPRELR